MNDALPDGVISTPQGRIVLHGEFTEAVNRRPLDDRSRPQRNEDLRREKPRDPFGLRGGEAAERGAFGET